MWSIIKDFFNGIIVALILAAIYKGIEKVITYFRDRNYYSINGFWVSKYNSAFDPEIEARDIVYIRSVANRRLITYHQYHNKLDGINIFKGTGYLSSNGSLAFSYQYSSHQASQVGVMLLSQIDIKSTKKAYSGKFYELDSRSTKKKNKVKKLKGKIKKSKGKKLKSPLHIYSVDYTMVKCKITLKQKIKFIFGKPVFKSFSEVERVFGESFDE